MIEKVILDYLNDSGFTAVMELPKDYSSERIVVIEKTGSSTVNRITESTFAIQSYGISLYDAASLNEEIKAAMDNAVTLPEISRVHLNSDYNFTNPNTKRPRYQAVFDITHY